MKFLNSASSLGPPALTMFWKPAYRLATRWMLDVFIPAISFAVLSDEHPATARRAAARESGVNPRRTVMDGLRGRVGGNGIAPAGSAAGAMGCRPVAG